MTSKEERTVIVEIRNGKGIVTVNRPKALNAITWEAFANLQSAVDELISDDSVRVIILTGAGEKAFISGGDIGEEAQMDGLTSYHWSLTGHKMCAMFEASPKPIIAAVNGYCLGGGFELMLACDFCICSDNAMFGAPESKLGVTCGFGGNIRLPRIVGKTIAKELLMTGRMFDANEAYRLNLVNRVTSQENLMNEVDLFCESLLDKSSNVLDFIKKAVDYGVEADLRSAVHLDAALFGVISATKDKQEGMNAFLEKRTPKFIDK